MSLTLWHPVALIGFLSRNRVRREERWRLRCRWCMGWRSCAVAQSSLLLSLLSPPLLLPQWNMQYLRYFLIWCKDTQILEMQKKDWHVSVLVIENEFDNYNLNLLLIKRIILRSRKTGFPTCSLDEFDSFPEDWKFTRQTRIRNLSPDPLEIFVTYPWLVKLQKL